MFTEIEIFNIKKVELPWNSIVNKLKLLDVDPDDEVGIYIKEEIQPQAIGFIEDYCKIHINEKDLKFKMSNPTNEKTFLPFAPITKILNVFIKNSDGDLVDIKDKMIFYPNTKTYSFFSLDPDIQLSSQEQYPIQVSCKIGYGNELPIGLRGEILNLIELFYNNKIVNEQSYNFNRLKSWRILDI